MMHMHNAFANPSRITILELCLACASLFAAASAAAALIEQTVQKLQDTITDQSV